MGRGGPRTGRWKKLPPWPLNFIERIYFWPDGCWTLGLHSSDRNVIFNPEIGKQEQAKQTSWRLYTGQEPPHRSDGMVLFLSCGKMECINPGHMELISLSEMNRRASLRNGGHDPLLGCPNGHGVEHRRRTKNGRLRCRACETAARRAYRYAHPEQEKAYNKQRYQNREKFLRVARDGRSGERMLRNERRWAESQLREIQPED